MGPLKLLVRRPDGIMIENRVWSRETVLPLREMKWEIDYRNRRMRTTDILYNSVSQPPGRGSVPGSGINYTGPREILLEFVILVL